MFGQNREKKWFSWRWAVLLVALVAGSLLLAACGDSDPSPTATSEPTSVQATPDEDVLVPQLVGDVLWGGCGPLAGADAVALRDDLPFPDGPLQFGDVSLELVPQCSPLFSAFDSEYLERRVVEFAAVV